METFAFRKNRLKGEILQIFRSENKVTLHNTLMKIPDREISVPLMLLSDREREMILSLVAPAKANRIREELKFQQRIEIRSDRFEKIVRKFIGYFGAGKKMFEDQSYLRPKRRTKNNSL
jgi:hypothetical protein